MPCLLASSVLFLAAQPPSSCPSLTSHIVHVPFTDAFALPRDVSTSPQLPSFRLWPIRRAAFLIASQTLVASFPVHEVKHVPALIFSFRAAPVLSSTECVRFLRS